MIRYHQGFYSWLLIHVGGFYQYEYLRVFSLEVFTSISHCMLLSLLPLWAFSTFVADLGFSNLRRTSYNRW